MTSTARDPYAAGRAAIERHRSDPRAAARDPNVRWVVADQMAKAAYDEAQRRLNAGDRAQAAACLDLSEQAVALRDSIRRNR